MPGEIDPTLGQIKSNIRKLEKLMLSFGWTDGQWYVQVEDWPKLGVVQILFQMSTLNSCYFIYL